MVNWDVKWRIVPLGRPSPSWSPSVNNFFLWPFSQSISDNLPFNTRALSHTQISRSKGTQISVRRYEVDPQFTLSLSRGVAHGRVTPNLRYTRHSTVPTRQTEPMSLCWPTSTTTTQKPPNLATVLESGSTERGSFIISPPRSFGAHHTRGDKTSFQVKREKG